MFLDLGFLNMVLGDDDDLENVDVDVAKVYKELRDAGRGSGLRLFVDR